jgi:diguanylate cyclase (GGDEF)-like protein
MATGQSIQHNRSSILPPPELSARFANSKLFFDTVFFNPIMQTYDVNRFLEMSDEKKDQMNREMISDAFSNPDADERALHIANCWTDIAQYFGRLAAKDGLTKLFNKIAFQDAMIDTLWQLERRRALPTENRGTAVIKKSAALIDIDLDRFKPFNDILGHSTGDAALMAVADLLKDFTRASDYSGRMGGDEFSLLLVDVNEEEAQSIQDRLEKDFKDLTIDLPLNKTITMSDEALEKIGRSTKNSWLASDLSDEEYAILGLSVTRNEESLVVSVDASFGMAMFNEGMDIEAIDAQADAAMYAYKNANRSNFPHYSR